METNNNFEYINKHYGVNAEIGRRIKMNGRVGVIVEERGHHLGVTFDDDKPGVISSVHPTWEMEYLEMGKIRQLTTGQKRYREYLDADWYDGTFAEWIGVDPASKNQREHIKSLGY